MADEMRAYDPTIRERMASALQSGMEGMGVNRYKARKHAETITGGESSNLPFGMGIADFVPFIGTTMGVEEGARDLGKAAEAVKRGDYIDAAGETAGAAMGLIPGGHSTYKAGKNMLKKLKTIDLPKLKLIETDSVYNKGGQTLKEWSMAGGGVPESHKGRADVWHKKAKRFAEGGEVYNTVPDMNDGGDIINGPAYAEGGEVHMGKGGVLKQFAKDAIEQAAESMGIKAAKKVDIPMPTARIGLEAPGIIIPSKINNVREAVRNIKGNYGARRVERAADEIRNLERMYQEDALKQAFTGDNAAAMMTLNPARFEEYATPINSTFTRPNSVRHTSSGERVTYPEYIEYLRSVGGFDSVPFLQINKQLQGTEATPFISGHEGRHRNRALSESGEKAGLVQLLPRSELREPFPRRTQEDYIEALRKEFEMTGNFVLPQINPNQPHLPQRPAIDLPDIYAEGGAVNMAKGGKVKGIVKAGLEKLFGKTPKGVEPIVVRTPEERAVIDKFGQKQEQEAVRKAIRAKALRDSKMGGTRGDIQETRRFFSEADWPKAVALMRQGMTPAAALAALGYNINAMAADER